MCFPPYCHPAHHVFGCLGLRQGAAGVLVVNALYGLCLVLVHALLLGEAKPDVYVHSIRIQDEGLRESRDQETGGREEANADLDSQQNRYRNHEDRKTDDPKERDRYDRRLWDYVVYRPDSSKHDSQAFPQDFHNYNNLRAGVKTDAMSTAGSTLRILHAQPSKTLLSRRLAESDSSGWMLEIMDLDLSWGHKLMGFDNQSNLVAGLAYGLVIITICSLMFYNLHAGGPNLPAHSRWFIAFMNVEMLLYVGLVLIKLPRLCRLQSEWMPGLYMNCPVQRFAFFQRASCIVIVGSFCIWIFSSFSYSLTFGHGAVLDHPDFGHQLDHRDAHITGKHANGAGPPYGAGPHGPQHSQAPPSRQSISSGVHAPQPHNAPRGMVPLASLPPPRPQRNPQRTSYHIGNMARAGSSTVSYDSDNELQPLIKPPLHIF
eukprot:TRINITY_DN27408_c0_g1_i1.p1 TRINITY_DN27408_c0_g1~~TRINITY_DN27408_c0_g1_i1.p1  ORF type:complete len:443 (+),score=23.16 TRINITY_DN27408_c0_g1_i1:40-1329(+)